MELSSYDLFVEVSRSVSPSIDHKTKDFTKQLTTSLQYAFSKSISQLKHRKRLSQSIAYKRAISGIFKHRIHTLSLKKGVKKPKHLKSKRIQGNIAFPDQILWPITSLDVGYEPLPYLASITSSPVRTPILKLSSTFMRERNVDDSLLLDPVDHRMPNASGMGELEGDEIEGTGIVHDYDVVTESGVVDAKDEEIYDPTGKLDEISTDDTVNEDDPKEEEDLCGIDSDFSDIDGPYDHIAPLSTGLVAAIPHMTHLLPALSGIPSMSRLYFPPTLKSMKSGDVSGHSSCISSLSSIAPTIVDSNPSGLQTSFIRDHEASLIENELGHKLYCSSGDKNSLKI
ncbi:hypothetical protein ADUPG1_009084 [Aduncisulcus paluster]|uniref:Uncharacterized protein n=1 Tax=Aduncisulcus paluster TaxID=2918883 RepID=A0ABQ5KVN1_9EUKA|nr:hypothetical protein ADUPG1_009084 [Aduncisulcus paluster]|eukprot:gnl/Carplike_NY0171/3419_a4613_423.p1 GENE.gnl/Carplike_NY0171/3419_a4613_423~~gnl/Carplike_NY0171/3419_a4613_423.p1  ORF type:complete len:341 (-),score=66.85 gnl/Carplike_NY0171/3419_a4613_423:138-1160(-)